jgi:undecaprenyl-diphosphatase
VPNRSRENPSRANRSRVADTDDTPDTDTPSVDLTAGARTMLFAYLVLTAATVGVGLLVTHVISGPNGWDLGVNEWFAARRTPAWDDASRYGSLAADTVTVIAIGAFIVFVLGCRRCWREVTLLATALVLEVTVFVSTTFLVDRDRPEVVRLDDAPPTSSFPSGHTAASVVLYVGLAIVVTRRVHHPAVRVLAWALAVAGPLVVGSSRLYRGMHFPTDVATGVLLGLACLAAAAIVVRAAFAARDLRPDHAEVYA